MATMMRVQIVGIRLDALTGSSAVLLGQPEHLTRVLPIIIGSTEAYSIAGALAGAVAARPGTHDLTTSLMELAGARLDEVAVTELVDGVFHAEVFVEVADGMKSVSARPSDGIALAMRVGAPIHVNEELFESAAVPVTPTASYLDDHEIDEAVEQFQAFLETASPSDFLDVPPERAPGDDTEWGEADRHEP